jgi:hypothetical protein
MGETLHVAELLAPRQSKQELKAKSPHAGAERYAAPPRIVLAIRKESGAAREYRFAPAWAKKKTPHVHAGLWG